MVASCWTFIGLIAYMIAVKLFFQLQPMAFPDASQNLAFTWTFLFVIAVMGLSGIWLAQRSGFPSFWDRQITNRQRFVLPAIAGMIYGAIEVLRDLPSPSANINLRFPYSLPFYSYGAIFLETMLRLFLIPLVVWLISNVVGRGRWQSTAFWIAAVLAAWYEPLPHVLGTIREKGRLYVFDAVYRSATSPLFLGNLLSGYFFRRFGFLAPLVMRLSMYLIWHILWGGWLTWQSGS